MRDSRSRALLHILAVTTEKMPIVLGYVQVSLAFCFVLIKILQYSGCVYTVCQLMKFNLYVFKRQLLLLITYTYT